MILLDTDTLTLLFQGNPGVEHSLGSVDEPVATTIITWMEILQGRFDAVFKASDASQLQRAHRRLIDSERQLRTLPIIPIDESIAQQFEDLLKNKKLRKIGRGDILITSFALAKRATLATRNLRDFRQISGLKTVNWAN